MRNLGERVEHYRKIKGLTRKQLCYNLCDESTIFRLEKNKHIPRLDILEEIALRLDVSLQDLLLYKDEELQRINNLFIKFDYSENYNGIKKVIDDLQNLMNKRGLQCPSRKILYKYYSWYKAILLHKQERKSEDARRILEKMIEENTYQDELDIDILHSLGKLHLDLKQLHQAYLLYKKAYKLVINKISSLNDFTLFPRIGYYFTLVLYHKQELDEALHVCYSILTYLMSNQLIYYRGEINFLIGRILTRKNLHNEANYHFQKATLLYLLEEKQRSFTQIMDFLKEENITLNEFPE